MYVTLSLSSPLRVKVFFWSAHIGRAIIILSSTHDQLMHSCQDTRFYQCIVSFQKCLFCSHFAYGNYDYFVCSRFRIPLFESNIQKQLEKTNICIIVFWLKTFLLTDVQSLQCLDWGNWLHKRIKVTYQKSVV